MTYKVDIQGLFRIQGKHPACSQRASYLGSTSWPDSPKLIKVFMTIALNRLSSLHILSLHITLFMALYFLPEILRIPDNGRKRNLGFLFFLFSRNSQTPPLNCKIHWENFLKSLSTMVGQQRKSWFLFICSKLTTPGLEQYH